MISSYGYEQWSADSSLALPALGLLGGPPLPSPMYNPEALCSPSTDCLSIARQQQTTMQQALKFYPNVLEQIAELADYDYYRDPLLNPDRIPIPFFEYLALSPSAHALTYINGHSDQALMGLCRDAHTARILIRDANDLRTLKVGSDMLRRSLHVAAQIIAELPLDEALPNVCIDAFAPFTAEEMNLSLCSAMRGEFAYDRSWAEEEKRKHNWRLLGTERLADWDHLIEVQAQQKAALCWPSIQQTLLIDEKFTTPVITDSAWLKSCQNFIHRHLNRVCEAADVWLTLDQSVYVHRMQDMGAHLQMMQALLWLRQQPDLPQRLTSDYLQTAVPANVYASTQRPLTVSDDGRELKIPAYEERSPDPCNCVRLPLPQALLISAPAE